MISKLEGLSYLGEFRFIPGYSEKYAVSKSGQIISFQRRHPLILKPGKGSHGYFTVSLGARNTKCVHTLVARVFLGSRSKRQEIDHINGDKNNNNVSNLRYVTKAENIKNAAKLWRLKGVPYRNTKLSKNDVLMIYKSSMSYRALARKYKVSYGCIAGIKLGLSWSWLTGAKR